MIDEIRQFRAKYPGYNDMDDMTLASKLASKYPDAYGDLPKKVGSEKPIKAILQKASPAVRSGLEMGGMVLGGVLATPGDVVAPGLANVAGAGAGYAAGKSLANIYDEMVGVKKPETSPAKVALDTGKNLIEGAAMEAGGGILGKALQLGGNAIAKSELPEKIYGSAVKTPLTKKWVSQLPGEEISQRTRAVRKGIEERIPPSEYGVQKTKQLEREAKNKVDTAVSKINKPISTQQILDDGLKSARSRAADSEAPEKANRIIDAWERNFLKRNGGTINSEYLTADKAEAIKRELYKGINWNESWSKELISTMRRGVANALKIRLEELNPALKGLNQNDAALINLREAIERSVARYSNRDMVDIGTKLFLTSKTSWPMAIVNSTIGHPQIKARVAFALSKAGKAKGNPKRATSYIIGKAISDNKDTE